MKTDTDAVTSETTSEETTSENKDETTSQNAGLSPEAIAEWQARQDAITAERDKYKTNYEQQVARAKKAEAALKEKSPEHAAAIDELKQRVEIAEAKAQERETKIQLLTNGQRVNAAQNAVLTSPIQLAKGAQPLLTKLIHGETGVYEGRTVVLTDSGTPRISAKTGKEMTVEELRDEILGKSPFLCASGVVSGQGTGDNTGGANAAIELTQWRTADPASIQKHLADKSKEYKERFWAAVGADMKE